ncbi:MAG: hypothetical protein E6F97_12755, partial [Actinobacteria bacterium]
HYDFRLERDGALASWAVPKGVPLDPGQQHLAVHVEDHPLDYATFEGDIPKGQYGAGTVEIWDSGTYELVEEKGDGGLTVRLHGKKLDGLWTLVPAHLDGKEQNWLILRKREDGAAAASGRKYAPMLATLEDEKHMPRGEGWEFEIKWDGYRIVSRVAGGEAELRTRKDQDYTKRFANVAKELAKALKTPDCVVDGEVCALDEEGRPSFSAMQQAKQGTPIVYYLFDLLEVEGEPLIDLPLSERRKRLLKLLDRRNRSVQFSESFDDGRVLLAEAKKRQLEGVMGKRLDSRYLPGKRSRDWLKFKAHAEQEFVIAGYTKGQGRREGSFGALVLGAYEGAGAEDAARSQGRRRVGRAEARRRGLVRRVHPRRPPARACLPGPARGQGRNGGAARARPAGPGCDQEGKANPAALEPRQGVLAGRGDHEGRPARVLPRRGGGRGPARARPAVHDEALSRRLAGQALLPEGQAGGDARLDPDGEHRGDDPRPAAPAAADRRAARERRARAAVDGEHGLHRPEHLVLAGRQARTPRLRALRPRPVARRRLPRDGAGRAAGQGGAGRARP